MALSGRNRQQRVAHESVHAVGRSAAEVRDTVIALCQSDGEFRFAEAGPWTYQLVRSVRPRWALICGVLGLPLAGLGGLLLLVHGTEACTLTIVEGSTGAVLTVSGHLPRARVDALRAAVLGRGGAATVPSTPEPVPVMLLEPQPQEVPSAAAAAAPPADETIGRSMRVPPLVLDAAPVGSPRPRLVARFDDGEIVPLLAEVVIGRDPSTACDGSGVCRVALADPQLSKSHVALGVDEQGAWVRDLHSTNGTYVHVHGRETVHLEPGEPHRLEPGSVVRFGARYLAVTRAD